MNMDSCRAEICTELSNPQTDARIFRVSFYHKPADFMLWY